MPRQWFQIVTLCLLVILLGGTAQAQTQPPAQSPAQAEEQLKVWLPEGAKIVQRLVLPDNVVTRVTAPSPPADVVAFYTERFKEEGWDLVSDFQTGDSYRLFALKGRRDATLSIDPDGRGGSRIRASVSRTQWQRIEPGELGP